MNIANIFGLHLGCWVKISRTGEKGKIINISTSLSNIGEGIITIEDLFSGMKTKYIKDCKLILKPLSAITDEDKAELEEFIKSDDNKHRDVYDVHWCPDLRGLKYRRLESNINLYDDSPKIMFKLATMGYDIGIIPDEYKEVEE
jgi:hypothetical protein